MLKFQGELENFGVLAWHRVRALAKISTSSLRVVTFPSSMGQAM